MHNRPILFSAEMVKSLLEGRKTVTRRTSKLDGINEAPDAWGWLGQQFNDDTNDFTSLHWFRNQGGESIHVRCPYGVAGDRLWVRESFRLETLLEDIAAGTLGSTCKDPVMYCADKGVRGLPIDEFGRVRSGRFMPRWASRLTLEVVSVRPERLHEITEADAISEGAGLYLADEYIAECLKNPMGDPGSLLPGEVQFYKALNQPLDVFRRIWESINGPGSWGKNPWVWRVEFKVMPGLSK